MLDFQLSTVIFTVLNLLILYVVLRKLLFGRVNRILEERAALVEKELSSAERQKAQAEEMRKEYEDQLAQAHAQAAKIVDQAKAKCNGFSKRVRYAMSHETGKIEILGMLNDKEMLFKYHQAKDPKNSSRIFTVELEDRQAWL